MSSRPSGLVLAGLAAVAALTLSACGSTSPGTASPGTAVNIGDQSLATSDVDDLSVAYCDGLEAQLKSSGAVFPMSYVRGVRRPQPHRPLRRRAARRRVRRHAAAELRPGAA